MDAESKLILNGYCTKADSYPIEPGFPPMLPASVPIERRHLRGCQPYRNTWIVAVPIELSVSDNFPDWHTDGYLPADNNKSPKNRRFLGDGYPGSSILNPPHHCPCAIGRLGLSNPYAKHTQNDEKSLSETEQSRLYLLKWRVRVLSESPATLCRSG